MPHIFEPAIVTAILHHMNEDHHDDNLLITRAFIDRAITAAVMIDLDGDGGTWLVTVGSTSPMRATISWPGGSISERPAVRRQIVALYDEACERLGVESRPHG